MTLADGKPNRIIDVSDAGVLVETERSIKSGTGPQLVPAWMLNLGWRHLQVDGSITNQHLLSIHNIRRSSAVCTLLAALPNVGGFQPSDRRSACDHVDRPDRVFPKSHRRVPELVGTRARRAIDRSSAPSGPSTADLTLDIRRDSSPARLVYDHGRASRAEQHRASRLSPCQERCVARQPAHFLLIHQGPIGPPRTPVPELVARWELLAVERVGQRSQTLLEMLLHHNGPLGRGDVFEGSAGLVPVYVE